MDRTAWNALLDGLARIEELPEDASGHFVVGRDPVVGRIFVEHRRICWAAARGMQTRLGDLLSACVQGGPIDLAALYEECRSEGKLLGETLVERGHIAGKDLAAALLRHSAESLVAMGRGAPAMLWSPRHGSSYAAQFSFRPIEVILAMAGICFPAACAEAQAELAPLAGEGRTGAAYLFEEATDVIVPLAVVGEPAGVAGLRSLGRWSLAVPRAARELGATPSFTLAASEDGLAVTTWWRGPLLFALDCDDRRAVAAIAARQLAVL